MKNRHQFVKSINIIVDVDALWPLKVRGELS